MNISIRTWKKIITFAVVLIIVTLLVLTVSAVKKTNDLASKYDAIVEKVGETPEINETLIDLSEYGYDTPEGIAEVIKYLSRNNSAVPIDYQLAYPELYVDNDFNYVHPEEKVCYLTFDDGPNNSITPLVLDTLKNYGVKATFFVVYREGDEATALYKRIVDEGHTIAIHTAAHDYKKIYASVDAYLEDFAIISNRIEEATGVKPSIFRFPGGSINAYNKSVYQDIISEMLRRGYQYYDWNCSSGDASGTKLEPSQIAGNVINTAAYHEKLVLMHDGAGHTATMEALPQMIEGLAAQGYQFAALTQDVTPIHFDYAE